MTPRRIQYVRHGSGPLPPEAVAVQKVLQDLLELIRDRMQADPPHVAIAALISLAGQYASAHATAHPDAADVWIEGFNAWIAHLEVLPPPPPRQHSEVKP